MLNRLMAIFFFFVELTAIASLFVLTLAKILAPGSAASLIFGATLVGILSVVTKYVLEDRIRAFVGKIIPARGTKARGVTQ